MPRHHSSHLRSLIHSAISLASMVTVLEGRAGLAEWQLAVETGSPAASKFFKDEAGMAISGQYPLQWDVGALEGDRSFEFIVFAGETGGSSVLMGVAGIQGLKFEQWQNTRSPGLTDYGVADHVAAAPSPFLVEAHLVFVDDGSDTHLYLNGELAHSFPGVPLRGTGLQWLGAAGNADGTAFGDRLDGRILGFASYDTALDPAEVRAHADAFAAGADVSSLSAWQAAVAAETAPTVTEFAPISGLNPIIVDVGELAGLPSTFEFVVHASDGGPSSALAGRGGVGGQGLKFEQNPNTRSMGLTNFTVVDLTSDAPASFDSLVHAAYVSDGVDTSLYLDGVWQHTFAGAPLQMGGQVALGAAADIRVTTDGTVFRDPLDGSVLRFASYDTALTEAEIAAHHAAFAGDAGSGSFAAWEAAVGAGTTAASTHFEPAAAADQVAVDIGDLTDDRTFEFIVNAGDAGPSGSIFGDGVQSLRFEQWNNSGMMGLTVYGVADHLTTVSPPLLTDTHIVFVSDGSETQLYVDGVWQHTFPGVALSGTGTQGLAASAAPTVASTVITYFDRLDGHVLGFAGYASALSEDELRRHAAALHGGGGGTESSLRITAVSRDPVSGLISLTWTSTPGRTYDILQSETLASFGQVAAAGVTASAGATTTHSLSATPANASQMFFKVKEL